MFGLGKVRRILHTTVQQILGPSAVQAVHNGKSLRGTVWRKCLGIEACQRTGRIAKILARDLEYVLAQGTSSFGLYLRFLLPPTGGSR